MPAHVSSRNANFEPGKHVSAVWRYGGAPVRYLRYEFCSGKVKRTARAAMRKREAIQPRKYQTWEPMSFHRQQAATHSR